VLFAIAGLALVPAAASAQDNVTANDMAIANTTTGDPALDPMGNDPMATDPALTTTNTYTPPPQEEDNDFPWGLLGLLGLAGLLGRKKRDHGDINVDNRTDRRNV
jgi:MYXO-CTERM domain-containing protein